MFAEDVIAVIAAAIKTDVAHPLGAMRHLQVSEEVVALRIVTALNAAGFKVVLGEQEPSS